MAKVKSVGEVMTRQPHTISVNEKLLNAKKLMARLKIRHLPVTERDQIVGLISDRDIKFAQSIYRNRNVDEDVLVRDICQFEPFSVEETEALDRVLMQMSKRRIGSVLITKNGKLTGILTTVDICSAFARQLRGEA